MGFVEVEILGVHEAVDLGVAFIKAGDGGLERKLGDALYEAHMGIAGELRASALARLPKRNGLAETVARSHITVSKSNGLGSPSVTIKASGPYNLQGLDSGTNIHPLFGNKRHWYLQHVKSGWFTDPLKMHQHTTTEGFLERAVDRYTEGIG